MRNGPNLSLWTVSLRLAIPLAIYPVYHLVTVLINGRGIGYILYAIAAIIGAGRPHTRSATSDGGRGPTSDCAWPPRPSSAS